MEAIADADERLVDVATVRPSRSIAIFPRTLNLRSWILATSRPLAVLEHDVSRIRSALPSTL